MLFVAAAGNHGRDTDVDPYYPASYDLPNVVAVAATTNEDSLWRSSNYGATSVDLAAPGEFVYSTIPGAMYAFRSGTSMATPHASGAAALVLSACSLDTAALRTTLLTTVDVVPSLHGIVSTGGRLNVDRAIRACRPDGVPSVPTGLTASAGDSEVALSWRIAGGATSYVLKRSATSGGPYDVVAVLDETTYRDAGLVNGVTYYYVLSARNAAGESAHSAEVSATPRLSPPSRPLNLQATPADASVALAWSAAERASSYRVKRSLERAGPYVHVGEAVSECFTDTSVVNGIKYFYAVSSVNETGESNDSNKASATPAPIPLAPDVTATQGPARDRFNCHGAWWNGRRHTGCAGARRAGGPYTGVRKATTTSFTDTGLKSGRRYYYFVTALNDSGEGPGIEVSAVAK